MDDIKDNRGNLSTFGSPRVNMMLGFGSRPGNNDAEIALIRKSRYGIGTKRTLEQAVEFTGINFRKKKMDVNKCGNLLWVPYEESPNYGVGETLSRGNAGEDARLFVVTPDASRSVLEASVAGGATAAKSINSRGVTTDYKLVGGLFLVALAVILKVSTRKRKKDENHKN